MPSNGYSVSAYQTVDIDSADKKRQLVMLFDASVRFLARARGAMEEKDYEGQCGCIVRVQKILSTLMCALDMETAPEFAGNLWQMYNFVHNRLTEASIKDDLTILDECLEIMTKLRDAWRQAEINCRAEEHPVADEATTPVAGGSVRHAA